MNRGRADFGFAGALIDCVVALDSAERTIITAINKDGERMRSLEERAGAGLTQVRKYTLARVYFKSLICGFVLFKPV
jgi:hypothetical protein